jgi:hypothetical protein
MSAPTPKEIIELSKERGYLAKQLYEVDPENETVG